MHFSIESITPHTFRHSFAMHLLYSRVHPKILQSFMGHRDYKSTEIYTRVFALDVAGQLGVRFEMTPEQALQLLSPNR
ncbi:Tyrosine recombinase XerD [compost metagenome]